MAGDDRAALAVVETGGEATVEAGELADQRGGVRSVVLGVGRVDLHEPVPYLLRDGRQRAGIEPEVRVAVERAHRGCAAHGRLPGVEHRQGIDHGVVGGVGRHLVERGLEALAVLSEQRGYVAGQLGRNVDDPALWVLQTTWEGPGAYRRALSAYAVKMRAWQLLGQALDEPSAYELVRPGETLNEARPRGI